MRTSSSTVLGGWVAIGSLASLLGCASAVVGPDGGEGEGSEVSPCEGDGCEAPAGDGDADAVFGFPPKAFGPGSPPNPDVCVDPVFEEGTDLTATLAHRGATHLHELGVEPSMYDSRRIDVVPCAATPHAECAQWEIDIDVAALASASSASIFVSDEYAIDPAACEFDVCTGESTHCSPAAGGTTRATHVESPGTFVQKGRPERGATLELSLPFFSTAASQVPASHVKAHQVLVDACIGATGLVWDDAVLAGAPADDAFEVIGMYEAGKSDPPVGCFYADLAGSYELGHGTGWLFSLATSADVAFPMSTEGAFIPSCVDGGFGVQAVSVPTPAMTTRYLEEWLAIDAGEEPTACPADRIPADSREAACGFDEAMSAMMGEPGEAREFCARVEQAAWGHMASRISEAVPPTRLREIEAHARAAIAAVVLADAVVESHIHCPDGTACSLAEMTVQTSPVTWTSAQASTRGVTFRLEVVLSQ